MQFPWSKNPVVVQVSYAKDIITYHQYRRDSSHRRQTARRAEAQSHTQSDGTCSLDSNTVEKSLGPETCRARVKMQPDTAVTDTSACDHCRNLQAWCWNKRQREGEVDFKHGHVTTKGETSSPFSQPHCFRYSTIRLLLELLALFQPSPKSKGVLLNKFFQAKASRTAAST
jgi:hypothetical protein